MELTKNPMDRRARIEFLARTNRRSAATAEFLPCLTQALDSAVDATAIASIEESDSLLEAFRSGYRIAKCDKSIGYHRSFSSQGEKVVFEMAACLADRLAKEKAFFLTKIAEDVEAVSVNISALLERAESMLNFDGDSLCVVSSDRTEGLLIDRNPDDVNQSYEVTVWGDRWPLCLLECEPDR